MKNRILKVAIIAVGLVIMMLTSTLGVEIAIARGRFYIMENVYKAELYINNQRITDENVLLHKILNREAADYAEMPFTAVLKGAGYEVNWQNDYIAEVTKGDREYILNLQEISLTEKNMDYDLIPILHGGIGVCKAIEKDVILDVTHVCYTLTDIGEDVTVNYDWENKKVVMTIEEDESFTGVTTIPERKDVKTTTATTVTTVTKTEISKADELNLTEEEKWSFNNTSKFIYYAENGCYYPVEIEGRASANYVLCFEDLDRNQTIFDEMEGYEASYYFDGNAIYMELLEEGGKYKLCKLENGEFAVLKEDMNIRTDVYFTEEYIYYVCKNDDKKVICRTDYNWENTEDILEFDNDEVELYNFAVYDNKVWYNYTEQDSNIIRYPSNFACYDMQTEERKDFDEWADNWAIVGRINNGYMYFVHGNEFTKNKLYRFNMQNETVELVLKADFLTDRRYCFFGDYILYSEQDALYKYDGKEKSLIFKSDYIYDEEDDGEYTIVGVQCQDDRIFIEVALDPFNTDIIEIDIDGNVMNTISEKPKE